MAFLKHEQQCDKAIISADISKNVITNIYKKIYAEGRTCPNTLEQNKIRAELRKYDSDVDKVRNLNARNDIRAKMIRRCENITAQGLCYRQLASDLRIMRKKMSLLKSGKEVVKQHTKVMKKQEQYDDYETVDALHEFVSTPQDFLGDHEFLGSQSQTDDLDYHELIEGIKYDINIQQRTTGLAHELPLPPNFDLNDPDEKLLERLCSMKESKPARR
uniref:ORF4 n=1 Tax=Malaco herpesvirus 1 TaxID=3031797 RepID=A0AA48SF04_9VIRU|nr:TPA_asm: ORF4 [Malaco herpesvirus 1]